MRTLHFRLLSLPALALLSACLLTSCETTAPRRTAGAPRPLPPYEPPLARANTLTVRTTAYTHSEADHLIYGRRNALGGILSSATVPRASRRVEKKPRRGRRVTAIEEPEYFTIGLMTREKRLAVSKKRKNAKKSKARGRSARSRKAEAPRIGSAAADWSRWPAGTVFKVLSTGQTYRVDDYGWALAGTNTIDLYMPSKSAMNSWGVRRVPIQVIKWGDPQHSLTVLRGRQSYRHVRRMVLALEGNHESAAALR